MLNLSEVIQVSEENLHDGVRLCDALDAVRDSGLFAPATEQQQRERLAAALSEPDELAKRIENMTPPAWLRLAAALLEARQPELALRLARRVADELSIVLAARKRAS
jgi:hypothetical protein